MKLLKHVAIGVIGISCVSIFAATKVEAATTAVVNVNSLNLREKATTSSSMVDGLVKGQELEVLEKLDGWYKVKVDGKTGYVSADYVKIKEESTNKNEEKSTNTTTSSTATETATNTNTASTTTATTTAESSIVKENEKTEENTKKEESTEFKVEEKTIVSNTKAYILPLINSNILKEIKKNAKVTVLDKVNGWYYIADDEINAWVYKTAFESNISNYTENEKKEENTADNNKKEEDNTNKEKQIEKKTMYVNTASINVRKGPGTTYEVVDTLVLNDKVYAIAEVDDWYKVEVGKNTGYIAKRLLSEKEQATTSRSADERESDSEEEVSQTLNEQTNNNSNSLGDEIVQYAKKYLGCPYSYGGSGPSVFDCSGFSMFVYKNFGINLSHSAIAQSKVGEYVSKENLMPGDLVFFKDYETLEGIAHVGIYVGDGNFIHASSGTGYCVKISTLLSGSYNTRYATARRVI